MTVASGAAGASGTGGGGGGSVMVEVGAGSIPCGPGGGAACCAPALPVKPRIARTTAVLRHIPDELITIETLLQWA
jgi:hypothetical protein